MTLRERHGKAKGYGSGPMVEVPPAEDQGPGLPELLPEPAGPERDEAGRFMPGNATSAKGGRGKRFRVALATRLGLGDVAVLPAFKPHLEAAQALANAERRYLREHVSGGHPSPMVESTVISAAMQRAAADFLFLEAAKIGDPDLFQRASRLADASRQNSLAARHLAQLDAKSRPRELPGLYVDVDGEDGAEGDE